MKKTNVLNKLVMLCLMSVSLTTHAQELRVNQLLLPNQAVELAQRELPNMLQLIEPENLQDYGFDAADNFSSVQIGRPFYVVNLPRTSFSSHTEIISINPTTIMLPIILDGSARCILYVSNEKGTWKTVGIGEANFIAGKQEVFNTTTNEDGSSQVIVSIPHLSQQYLMMQQDVTTFKPLIQFEGETMENISLAVLFDLNNTTPMEATEVTSTNTPQQEETPTNNK